MDGNKYCVSVKTPYDAPPEYHKHQLEAGRRKAGNELYNILYSQKMPAVVDIHEIVIPARNSSYQMYPYPEHELRIEITVMPVQHRHITMSYADMDLKYRLPSLMARLKWKVKKFVWSLRRK